MTFWTARNCTVEPPPAVDAEGVKRIRASVGLSQSEFARLVGVSLALVQSWEQGKRAPRGSALRMLEQFTPRD